MSITLIQAYQRRRWLLASSIVENILFSAILLGWPALVSILQNEGFFGYLCTSINTRPKATIYDFATNSTRSQSVEVAVPLLRTEHSSLSPILPPALPSHEARLGSNLDQSSLWPGNCCPHRWSCPEQEKSLHSCFTVGCFLMNVLTIPVGLAVNKFGPKWLRCAGTAILSIALILFACSSARSSHILIYACALTGFGGNIIAYTSLQIANLFGSSRSSTLGLLVGSYAASAVVFPTLKVLYALGVPLQVLFLLLAVATVGVIVNTIWNYPNGPIPVGVESLAMSECRPILSSHSCRLEKAEDETLKEAASPVSTANVQADSSADGPAAGNEAVVMPLHRVIFMPMVLWSIIVVAITQLRLLFFVGDLHQMLVHTMHDNVETIDLYIFIFGILQICCLGTTHFIDGFVEWRNKKTVKMDTIEEDRQFDPSSATTTTTTTTVLLAEKSYDPGVPMTGCDNSVEVFFNVRKSSVVHLLGANTEGEGGGDGLAPVKKVAPAALGPTKARSSSVHSGTKLIDRKIGKLKDCAAVFFVTSMLTIIFGLLALIPSLTIQVSTFVCYTLIRGFVPCAVGRLYAVAFHSVHHHTLVGLTLALSAVFSLAQHPLFIIVTDFSDGDPYWVNMALLLLSLLTFVLPLHLLFHCRHLEQWRQTSDAPPTAVQPVAVKMQYIDSKLTGRGTPTEL